MTEKFQNTYRIPSARLQKWNYGWDAAYFVTICTKDRECYFGEIVDGEMKLSEIGEVAQDRWIEIPNHFTFVEADIFQIMPNHIHGIIIINRNDEGCLDNIETPNCYHVETPKLVVSTGRTTFNASQKWHPGTLGVIINQFKRVVTINARKIHPKFAWQSRFHDHIIRNDESFEYIQNYIINNPVNWRNDKFYNER